MKPIFVSFALLGFVGCSHDPLEPGGGNNAGGGSKTLVVIGDATAHPRITNAANANDFDTDFSVRVSLNNQAVTTGTVTITSKLTKVTLTYMTNGGQFGHWSGTQAGYDEVYQLDVTSGSD